MASVGLNTLEPLRMKVCTFWNTLLHLCLAVEALSEPSSAKRRCTTEPGVFTFGFPQQYLFIFFNPIIHWDSLRHLVALKEEEESSKPEEFTGKLLCGGKSCFIAPLSGQTVVKHSRSAWKQRYVILSFDGIVLKYAVFSKNSCLFDWCAGFLVIFTALFLPSQIKSLLSEQNWIPSTRWQQRPDFQWETG